MVLMLGLAACGSSSSSSDDSADDAEEETTEESGIYVPGTYSASAKGLESSVTVTITVDANSITDVEIDASGETESLGGAAAEVMTESILEAQSADIDGYSGATYTSDAIIEALTDCLEQAAAE